MNAKQGKALLKKQGKKSTKGEWDSAAEEIYFQEFVQPLLDSGEVVSCETHRSFEILPAVRFQGKTYRARVFTPDFLLTYRGGHVKVVEVKSKYVRRAQRDYALRRQLFLLRYCIPNNWAFEEVCSDDLMKGRRKPGK